MTITTAGASLSELPEGSEVELNEIPIIIWVPKELAALQITALMPNDNNLLKVTREMTAFEVFEANQEYERLGEEGFTYQLTDKGREWSNSLEETY